MSDVMTESAPFSAMQDESSLPQVAPTKVDVIALTRALVFTKETIRTPRVIMVDIHPQPISERELMAQVLQAAVDGSAAPVRLCADRALTPWDLIDEDPSPTGVEFTMFQRRAREARELAA